MHAVLREGQRPAGDPGFHRGTGHSDQRTQLVPDPFDHLGVGPGVGPVIAEATQRGPYEVFPGTGQMRPFLREVRARRDGPLLVAPPGAP